MPIAAASSAACWPSASSRPMSTTSPLSVGEPRELAAEAGSQHGDANGARDVRLIELPLGADVDEQRAGASLPAPPDGGERMRLDGVADSSPRLSATMFSKFGGWGPRLASACSTKASSSVICRTSLCACSNPIVEETLRSMPGPPHIDPPRCPGQTSTSGGSDSNLPCSERKISRAPSSFSTARSGRATSPTNSVSPVSTAHGSSPPRLVSTSRNAVCSGRCPGVCSARIRSAPISSSQPSSNGSWSYAGSASVWMWMVAPVAAARRPCPETWSAWLCVSRMCSICTPTYRASVRYSSMSSFGSITAATPASSSPTRYDAQPRSSWVIWRKIMRRPLPRAGRLRATRPFLPRRCRHRARRRGPDRPRHRCACRSGR